MSRNPRAVPRGLLDPSQVSELESKDAEEYPELVFIKSKVLSRTENIERLREEFKRQQPLVKF